MAMNIKNQEAYDLARQLAREEGKSITQVVLEALRDRYRQLDAKERRRKFNQLRKEMAKDLEGLKSTDIDDLYDEETGLPK